MFPDPRLIVIDVRYTYPKYVRVYLRYVTVTGQAILLLEDVGNHVFTVPITCGIADHDGNDRWQL